MENTIMIRESILKYGKKLRIEHTIKEPKDIAKFVRKVITDETQEHVIAIYLDGSHTPCGYSLATKGLFNFCHVHPREIFQKAIMAGAAAIVISHNHPSGNLEPSNEDTILTKQVKDAGTLLGIKLLDHVIVSNEGFMSFQERGLL